ncbi:MAG: macrolide ABC transporter ATP-binding protein [Candidatus Levybacteria bacterium RIFCSPHIGHO2_01_FULL_37_33]|nr:MAG: macrolide ABC transporter ATP-binding protein [Candidatus Levybacteria bacterium RIFCSPHIGHO2_01_FULL_37_33]OGH17537.1 MAG: macrolide ABC transporter ATP-binding protein [Candidatus Levybacteria bacterium RIFCSPHIGHO2_02_FULL_37_11]OGH29940.1 MAG: macrolide ABC transporter ATP-binding protein [Candidatus Levybacteria bacterium RIFCSPHIGHO2_12_FULL_37_12]OGH32638.1 MAG: macrolide ABC transporter ATP-binding protein [Candidatus Levybacteria bacterium RIFCSPLOWO2_01_FULL_36_54]
MKKTNLISLANVTKDYNLGDLTVRVLKGITLKIKNGEFVAIQGRSGSGKSTLMNIIGLLDTPTAGSYYLEETDVSSLKEDELSYLRNKKIGFVFQSFNLLPRATILENVVLPGIYAGENPKERDEKAGNILEKIGLLKHISKRPNQLSGGEQQRVAIARALMNNPDIILADEPTGNLDTKSGQEVINLLKTLHKQGKTIVLITHEKDIAKQADRIIKLTDGRIN